MDNPETLATLDTRTKGRRQTKQSHTAQHKKLKRSATRTHALVVCQIIYHILKRLILILITGKLYKLTQEKLEDTKGIIRSLKSKE